MNVTETVNRVAERKLADFLSCFVKSCAWILFVSVLWNSASQQELGNFTSYF